MRPSFYIGVSVLLPVALVLYLVCLKNLAAGAETIGPAMSVDRVAKRAIQVLALGVAAVGGILTVADLMLGTDYWFDLVVTSEGTLIFLVLNRIRHRPDTSEISHFKPTQ